MNAAPLTVARTATSSICLSCRRSIFRQFTSASRLAIPAFQSYRLNPQPPSPPRSAGGPDTSITHPIEPPMPRVHETRPPTTLSQIPSIREELAQQSQPAFAPASSSSSSPAQPTEAPEQKTSTVTPSPSPSSTPSKDQHHQQQQEQQEHKQPPSAAAAAATAAATPKARPRSKLRAPRKAAMKLTPTAVEQLRALLDQPEPKLIKVGVRNRGCSGLAYHLEYVDKAGAFDEAVEQDGVKVLIDSKALFSIIGSEMDWIEDKLNERFVFRNPNIKEQCGCGESFMV